MFLLDSGDIAVSDVAYSFDDSLSDPKFLAGVAGGIMFEAGMIASMTGVGLPVGLALMGAGTLCTAYSCGLFDCDSDGNYVGSTTENLA